MTINTINTDRMDPHASGKTHVAGTKLEKASSAVIYIHGRGASAESILSLHESIGDGKLAALAPQAVGNSWYPQSFLAPVRMNQPYLKSALKRIGSVVEEIVSMGIPQNQIVLCGFSQGACLAAEFAGTHAGRFGAVLCLSGGLIGENIDRKRYAGFLESTPIFLGSADPDAHVPFERVEESAEVFASLGGEATLRRYPGMPHTITEEEIAVCRQLIGAISQS